jgi:protein OS-9
VKEWYQAHQLADAAAAHSEVQTVGGIVVGGQQLVGMEGKKIEKGRVASAGEETVEVVLKRENGEIQRPSKQVMKKYNIDQETIESMKRKLDAVAEGRDWTLEVVESNGVIKLQGAIEKDEDEAEEQKDGDSSSQQSAHQGEDEPAPLADGNGAGVSESGEPGSESETAQDSKLHRQASEDEGEESVGSEETFKDEL